MKVYLNARNDLSRAMHRVVNHLVETAPESINVVNNYVEADFVVIHAIGHVETKHLVEQAQDLNKQYAIIQYCLRSTEKPNTTDWIPLWSNASVVWSYYDLEALCKEDGNEFPSNTIFFFAPLGGDSATFNPGIRDGRFKFGALTTGTVAPSESIDLVNRACSRLSLKQAHVGLLTQTLSTFDRSCVEFYNDISDNDLARLYRQSQYVAGLRKIEGFELPAVEALLSGVTPILFNKPHYRNWFEDLGVVFIEEGTDEEIYEQLLTVLQTSPEQPNVETAKQRFNWNVICSRFWQAIPTQLHDVNVSTVITKKCKKRKKLLWVGDAVASTGFAKGTHKILDTVKNEWDVVVLGLNYFGDPHDYPYKIYPARNGGDFFGVRRLPTLIEETHPDVVVIQNDPWNFPEYFKKSATVPMIGVAAVDGLNCRGEMLNGLEHCVFWTKFGQEEAAKGGYRGSSSVIPLGVDRSIFKPMDRQEARKNVGLPEYVQEAFIVGNINRNQPRKRLDLTIQYFCEWVKEYRLNDVYLFLHVAPTGDSGYDVKQLMRYYGMNGRLILSVPELMYGVKETALPYTYNSFDVQVSTSQGEGFGLTTLEGMACGVPQIAPNWAALGDLFCGTIDLVSCSSVSVTPNDINAIGGVPDKDEFIDYLHKHYKDPMHRMLRQNSSIERASAPEFEWSNIGQQYLKMLESVFTPKLVTNA